MNVEATVVALLSVKPSYMGAYAEQYVKTVDAFAAQLSQRGFDAIAFYERCGVQPPLAPQGRLK